MIAAFVLAAQLSICEDLCGALGGVDCVESCARSEEVRLTASCQTCINTSPTRPSWLPAQDEIVSCCGEVANVWFYERDEISWCDDRPSNSYDVAQGFIGTWGAAATCLAMNAPGYGAAVPDPPPGLGYWFLVRGKNICGPGTWGWTWQPEGGGQERQAAVCVPISNWRVR